MAALDENQVQEMLFGDTDPREVALFLAQQSLTMDPVQRHQRETILNALSIRSNQAMAVATANMAAWTRRAVWTAVVAILVSSAVGITALILDNCR